MDIQSAVHALMGRQAPAAQDVLQLRPGQIFHAHVQRLFPNEHAEIRMNSRRLIAKLEVPLEAGKGYFLQVVSNDGEPALKLVGSKKTDLASVAKQLSIPNDKGFRILSGLLSREPMQMTKEQMSTASKWLTSASDENRAMRVISYMSSNNLPFTQDIFHSLLAAADDRKLTGLLHTLKSKLKNSSQAPLERQLIHKLDEMVNVSPKEMQGSERTSAATIIKEAAANLGVSYERMMLAGDAAGLPPNTLKALLIQYLHETAANPHASARQVAEQIIHKMNGTQLLSIDTGPVQQTVLEVPVIWNAIPTDLKMQFEGKKKQNGTIDPDYCRVILYLELPYLKETAVDVQIQSRMVLITVYNDTPGMKALAQPYLPQLAEQLLKINYQLTSVRFKQPEKEQSKPAIQFQPQTYTGVDIQV